MDGELVAVGRARRSTSSRTRCTTARACSRASAPTRPTTGPAVFRLTDHIERLFDSAKIMHDGHPVHGRRARRGDEGHRARRTGCDVLLHPPDRVPRLRRDGAQHAAVHGRTSRSRCWPWGAYLGDEALQQRRAHEGLVVAAHGPQHQCRRGQGHRHLRELVARQGRGAEGRATTRRSCSTPHGLVAECTGENIFVVQGRRARSRRRCRPARSRASRRTRS